MNKIYSMSALHNCSSLVNSILSLNLNNWILALGLWEDEGIWIDTELWNDGM